jgi:hypothetical protein
MNNEQQRGIGPGNWLVLCSTVYMVVALSNLAWPFTEIEYIQAVWLVVLSLPLWLSPVSKFVGIKPLWKR